MQLADDHALGPIDDERAVLGHQRNFTEVNFLFLDIPYCFGARIRILIENREADDDFQWRRIGHAPFLAFSHVVLQVQLNRIAALVAEGHLIFVHGAAFRAHDGRFGLERIGGDRRAARLTGASQMMQAFQVSAFAFPVADGIADELECRNAPEIGDGKNGIEHGLKPGIFAFLRKHVHLEEPLVRILLDLDEIRDLDRGPNLREIRSVSRGIAFGFRHFC